MPQDVIFTISVDPELVPDGDLQPLLEALQDFEPVLDEFEQTLKAGEKAGFATQGAAYGSPWAALAPQTVADRSRQGFGGLAPLVRSGTLAGSVGQDVLVTPDSVEVGIDDAEVPYAAYQQEGRGHLPARLLVAVSEDMIDEMMLTLRQYLQDAAGGSLAGIGITAEAF